MTNINSRVSCFWSLEHTLWEDLQVVQILGLKLFKMSNKKVPKNDMKVSKHNQNKIVALNYSRRVE